MAASDVTSNFGILTPPAIESPSEMKNSFFPTASSIIKGKGSELELSEPSIPTAPPSVHDTTDGSSEPSTPTSSGPVVQSGSRYYIYDNTIIPMLIPQIAAARKINVTELYPYASSSASSSSVRSSSPGADIPASSGGNDAPTDINVKSSSFSVNGVTSSKRKRKGIPFKSPNREDLERDPGMVFCFPAVFPGATTTTTTTSSGTTATATTTADGSSPPSQQVSSATTNGDAPHCKNAASPMDVDVTTTATATSHGTTRSNNGHHDTLAGPSAVIIHHPILLSDIVRSITQARRSKMRSRPVTRAKNKRENMELELLSYGLEGIIDTDGARNSDDPLMGPSRRTVANTDQRFMSSFSTSQISRSSTSGASSSGDKKLARSSTGNNGNNSSSYYHASKKRRNSISVSSLSSIPTSELSDYELNSDNFGDDEDDPDFTLHAKKRKTEHVSSKVNHSSSTSHASHRRDSNNKTKICASCRTRSTPCWRPGWRTDLFLCNSCGLRYKKTKCVCTNPDCRYIPLKSEYNAMFKKPKNGDSPDLKRCCKCQTIL